MRNMKNELSEALRLCRVFSDMSAVDLAKRLQVSGCHVSAIEHGRKIANVHLINKYAKIFRTTPSAILLFSENISGVNDVRVKISKFVEAVCR